MCRDVKFIADVFSFATPKDVHIESHGFEFPYDIHDGFVEYEYIDNVVHDVHNSDSENTGSVGDSVTASSPDEAASTQQHQPEAMHRNQRTDADKGVAGQALGHGFQEKSPRFFFVII